MPSYTEPTPQEIEKLIPYLAHTEKARHFFEKLENPSWLLPLHYARCFDSPPPAVRNAKEGTFWYPRWPQSESLARLAAYEPAAVSRIITELPETDNLRVRADIIEALVAMPASFSVALLPKAEKWIGELAARWPIADLGRLITHLAEGGQTKAAFKLAREIFAVFADPSATPRASETEPYRPRPEPRSYCDDWHYEELLKDHMPALVKVAPIETVNLLSGLLSAANKHSFWPGTDPRPEDLSHIWRPAIENHEQNWEHGGLREILVNALREVIEAIASENPSKVPDMVRLLEKQHWNVFRRVSLHILRLHPKVDSHLVQERLLRREYFEATALRHEYALLLRSCFDQIPEDSRNRIMNWIEQGPDIERFREYSMQQWGKEPTLEDKQRYKETWQRDRLSPIAEFLSERARNELSTLIARHGKPQFDYFTSLHSVGGPFSPSSPKSSAELQAMSADEVAKFLEFWNPSDGFRFADRATLGLELRKTVEEDPDHLQGNLSLFLNVHATYLSYLIGGFGEAVRKGRAVDWPLILDFSTSILNRPMNAKNEVTSGEDDELSWNWVHQAIAQLIKHGLEQETSGLSKDLRQQVWQLLEPLTKRAGTEIRLTPDGDPVGASLNSARGVAMHTVIEYAVWVRKLDPIDENRDSSFSDMAEVARVLDEHLDPAVDPDPAIRSIYGQRLHTLYWLDRAWMHENLHRMFPGDVNVVELWEAAWNGFVVWTNPHYEILRELEPQYNRAITKLRAADKDARSTREPEMRLVHHLFTYYWHGDLTLDGSGGLLRQFYMKGTKDLEAEAMRFIGFSLKRANSELSSESLGRLQMLWDKRWRENVGSAGADRNEKELANFGSWFVSAKFDDNWSLEQLRNVLTAVGHIDIEHAVFKRLTEMVEAYPLAVLDCLNAAIEGDREGWQVLHFSDSAKAILRFGLKSEEPIRQRATQIIHLLGRYGHFEFGQLLKES